MRNREKAVRFAFRLFCAIVAVAAIAQPQAIGPDEVRVSSRAYSPQSNAALRANTEVVDVGVVPRDLRGRAISGLKQEDFEVYDDGKQQTIKTFAIATREDAVAMRANTPAKPSEESQPAPRAASVVVAPRSIALFFDDIHTNTGDLGRAKIAARRFLANGLIPGDRVALFTSSATATVSYTSDPAEILAVMDKLQAHPRVPENGIAPCPRITAYQAYLISNNLDPEALQAALGELMECNGVDTSEFPGVSYQPGDLSGAGAPTLGSGASPGAMQAMSIIRGQADQTWEMAKQASLTTLDTIVGVLDSLSKQPGTRMLVLTSSGFLAGTMDLQKDDVIARALRSGTVVNAIDAKGLYAEAPGPPPGEVPNTTTAPSLIFNAKSLGSKLAEVDAPMADFAESTGGLLFHNNNDLDLAFREVGMVPEVTYLLGTEPAHDGKYHHLHVKVRGVSNDFVQARPGYFAPRNQAQVARADNPQGDIDKEVVASEPVSGVPATVSEQEGPMKDGSQALWVSVHVDVVHLKFGTQSHRHTQQLVFVSALFDDKGNFVVGKESRMDLMLKDASFAELSKTGITAKTFLQAPPGRYSLREVVRDQEGKLFASTSPVEIR